MRRIDEAIGLSHEGKVEEALAMLARLRDDGTVGATARGHRAWILKSTGRYEEALLEYGELLALAPENREAARQRVDTIRSLGRAHEALGLAIELLRAEPMDRAASQLVAACQEAAGSILLPPAPSIPTGPPPPTRPLNPVIDSLERDPAGYPWSCFPEVGRAIYALTRCLRPQLVIESGSFVGYSTLCIAQAMEENGGGHVHAFDIFPEGEPYQSPVVGQCRDRLEAARGHAQRAGLAHRITFHRGDSSTEMAGFLRDFPGKIDMAFIDGDHSIRGCLKDFHVVDGGLKPGGVILVHDTVPERCNHFGPRYLLEELPARSRGEYQAVNLPSPEGFGLGILQKRGGLLVGEWRVPMRELLRDYLMVRTRSPG